MWIFLFSNKLPPIATFTSFLANHGTASGLHRVRTDKGGDLVKSIAFCKYIQDAGYTL